MGMYDDVAIRCPKCETINYFQSKAGDCKLQTFSLADAPEAILRDLEADSPLWCEECGSQIHIRVFHKLVAEAIIK